MTEGVTTPSRRRWPRGLGQSLHEVGRRVGVGVLAGLVAGFIVGGIGSRAAMRIAAITTEDRFKGLTTEADATVGEITLGGTVFLLFFGTVLGIVGGVSYMAARRWLVVPQRWQGLVFGLILLAIAGPLLIEGDNRDFQLFGPKLLNISMFASLPLLFGLMVVPLAARLDRALPGPSLRPRGVGRYVPVAAFGLPILIVPPAIPPLAYLLLLERAESAGILNRRWLSKLPLTGYAMLAIPAVVGAVLLVRNIDEIYR